MSDQAFAISITALHDNLYRVTTQTPEGEFTAERGSPFEKAELRDVLALLADENVSVATAKPKIRFFGVKLFNFLIGSQPDILNCYRKVVDRAGKYRLFIRISSEQAGRLAALPWELICDPAQGFLALSPKTPIIRHKPELEPRPPAPLILPLRVLVVMPSPPNYPSLDIEAEWKRLSSTVSELQASDQIRLERLEQSTWSGLRRQLRAEDYSVIHYIGYTHFDDRTQQGFLALEDDHNVSGSRAVSAAELGGEMGTQSTVRLFILNTRRDPSTPQSKAHDALGYQCLQTGMPGVIVTQFPLTEEAEAVQNIALYPPLCEGHPVEAAVNVARRAMSESSTSFDWYKMALFLRVPDGHLFRPLL